MSEITEEWEVKLPKFILLLKAHHAMGMFGIQLPNDYLHCRGDDEFVERGLWLCPFTTAYCIAKETINDNLSNMIKAHLITQEWRSATKPYLLAHQDENYYTYSVQRSWTWEHRLFGLSPRTKELVFCEFKELHHRDTGR